MKVAIYSRVSTHDQDEQLQVPRLRDFCNRLGYEIYKEYSDVASGKNANRPGWKALQSDARRGEFEAIIVVKLDRIMRSLAQLLDVLQISIIAMVAQWEREIISERTKEALRAKKAKGEVLGRPSTDFPLHRAALLRIEGKSWKAIAEDLGIPRTTLNNHRKEIEAELFVIHSKGDYSKEVE